MRERMTGVRRVLERAVPVAIVLAVAVVAVAPALEVRGIVATRAGGDSPFLLQRTQQMAAALADGHFPPRWMPDAAYGLGYPFWNYYAPLAYLLAGLLAVLGGGVVGAVKVTLLVAYALGALGMLRLGVRTWGTVSAGVLAAVAYTVAPFHLVNVYVRGDALAELAAYALFPWVLVAVDRAAERHDAPAAGALAIVTALLAVSHNISVMLFLPVLAGFAVWRLVARSDGFDRRSDPSVRRSGRPERAPVSAMVPVGRGVSAGPALVQRLALVLEWWSWPWRERRDLRRVLVIGAGAALGALLSMWFWLPALGEAGAVQLAGNLTGYFDYRGHFLGTDLVDVSPLFRYGADAPWRTGLAQLAVGVLGAAAAAVALPRRRGALAFWLVVAACGTLLMTSLSSPVWTLLSPLRLAQFPWRWLSIQALALAILAGALGASRRGPVFAVLAGAVLAVSGLALLPVETLGVRDVTRDDIAAFEVVTGNIGSTVRGEYLPQAVQPRPMSGVPVIQGHDVLPRAIDAAGEMAGATRVTRGVADQVWRVDLTDRVGSPTVEVAFPTLSFPGWTVRVKQDDAGSVIPPDDVPLETPLPVGVVDGSGWISVALPPGQHTLELRLDRTALRAVAEGVSLAALGVLGLLLLADRRRRWGRVLLALVAALVVGVFCARLMPRAEARGPRTLDYERAPYPHYNPDGLTYGTARLVDTRMADATIDAGSDLSIALQWENARDDQTVELALVSPAAIMPAPGFGVPDVRAVARQKQTDPAALVLPVGNDVASGLYLVRLRVTDATGVVTAQPADGPARETVYLGPVRIRGQRDFRDRPASPVARFGDLVLHAVQAAQDGESLEVRMYWQSDRTFAREYKTSVRLVDSGDETVAQVDALPLYGFLPTTAWEAGGLVLDRRWLPLPDNVKTADDYRVEIVVYEERAPESPLGTGVVSGVRVTARSGAEAGRGETDRE